jgi:hypothetical protein
MLTVDACREPTQEAVSFESPATPYAQNIARPDQHVAHVLPLDGFEGLVMFFEGFMLC